MGMMGRGNVVVTYQQNGIIPHQPNSFHSNISYAFIRRNNYSFKRKLSRCMTKRRARSVVPQRVMANEGMYIPSDSFGGVSPEAKAAEMLETFFTFAAVKIVMSQLEGIGRGDLGAYNAEGYSTLSKFLREKPLRNNADQWLADLMQEDEMIALRICEVRAAYAGKDFEWHNLKRLTVDGMQKSNVSIQRDHMKSKYGKMFPN